jgi:hypothetical protein
MLSLIDWCPRGLSKILGRIVDYIKTSQSCHLKYFQRDLRWWGKWGWDPTARVDYNNCKTPTNNLTDKNSSHAL